MKNRQLQIRIIALIWLAIALGLLASQIHKVPINECTFLEEGMKIDCTYILDHNKRLGHAGPAYNQPALRQFPMVTMEGNRAIPTHSATSFPDTMPLFDYDLKPGRQEPIPLSIAVEDDELGWDRANIGWAAYAFDFQCDGRYVNALKLRIRNGVADRITFVQYLTAVGHELSFMPLPMKISWDGDAAVFNDEFKQHIGTHNEKARKYLDTHDLAHYQRYRVAIREIVELPHSLFNETGVPRILTYVTRNDMVNKDHDVEYYTYDRVILLPFERGTIRLTATTTSLGGQTPVITPWQDIWKNVRFENGIPDNTKPYVDDKGRIEELKSLPSFYKWNLECSSPGSLPPRWAWPKYAPKYQLPFWPHWTFG